MVNIVSINIKNVIRQLVT